MSLIDNSFLANEFRISWIMPNSTITTSLKQRHLEVICTIN